MRNAILRLSNQRTIGERRQVLRAAIRQVERAEVYLAAVAYMELDDREAQRAVEQLRIDVAGLRSHLGELRNTLGE